MLSRHYRITGRVQGVAFRASTARQARSLELKGWVKNCNDGSVEVRVAGDEQRIKQLETWLQHGPPLARVDTVSPLPVTSDRSSALTEFSIRQD